MSPASYDWLEGERRAVVGARWRVMLAQWKAAVAGRGFLLVPFHGQELLTNRRVTSWGPLSR